MNRINLQVNVSKLFADPEFADITAAQSVVDIKVDKTSTVEALRSFLIEKLGIPPNALFRIFRGYNSLYNCGQELADSEKQINYCCVYTNTTIHLVPGRPIKLGQIEVNFFFLSTSPKKELAFVENDIQSGPFWIMSY